MKVALTGAAGHLGSALLQELCLRNIPVKALIRGNDIRSCSGLPVEIVKGNLLDPIDLQILLKGCDHIIHCAAQISVNADPNGNVWQTNVEGTRVLFEQALKAGIKRSIHISSIHSYKQQPSFEKLDELRDPIDEKGFVYDRSKLAGQKIALEANKKGMEVLVIQPTSIIGPYDHKPSLMGQVLIDMYNCKLPFIFNGGFDFCDCRDIASAIANSLTMGRPGESYLLSGKWHSLKQLAVLLSDMSGKSINIKTLPAFAAYAALPIIKLLAAVQKKQPLYTNEALEALFNGNRFINSEKAMREINYNTRPLEETISETYQWFKNKSYL